MKKKLIVISVLLLLNIFMFKNSFSQVMVTGTVGSQLPLNFSTLKEAFDNINNGVVKGIITINITGNVTETNTAVLKYSGFGSSQYSQINIFPQGGNYTITGNSASLIQFDGANNVTIDGKKANGESLTFQNPLSYVINYKNGASNNILTKCAIYGGNSSSILYSSSSVKGCSNNTVSFCDVGSISGFIQIGISSEGGTANNMNLNFNNNNIFNVSRNGIYLGYSSRSKVYQNRIYNTNTYLYTSSLSTSFNAIEVLSGGGYIIEDNIIGYASKGDSGYMKIVANSVDLVGFPNNYSVSGTARNMNFIGIYVTQNNDSLISHINNNRISNIAFYTGSSANGSGSAFCGIRVVNGESEIGTKFGNVVGAAQSLSSIYFVTNSSMSTLVGIKLTTSRKGIIKNNLIGGIDISNSSTQSSGSFIGIFASKESDYRNETLSILKNTVGNEIIDNIRIGSFKTGSNYAINGTDFLGTGKLGYFIGIHDRSTGISIIGDKNNSNIIRNANLNVNNAVHSNDVKIIGIYAESNAKRIAYNSIFNLKTNGHNINISSTIAASGIIIMGGNSDREISYNTIHDIFSMYSNAAVANVGIAITTSSRINIKNNKIYNLFVAPGANIKPTIAGIYLPNVTAEQTLQNNMISLGIGQILETDIVGIRTANVYAVNVFNNSIYIGGNATKYTSFCLQRGFGANFSSTICNIKNNVFVNNRISPDSVDNYVIANNYKLNSTLLTDGWGEMFTNNNFYFNYNPQKIGYWNGAVDFKAWISRSYCDSQSISGSIPSFVDSLTADLHIKNSSIQNILESSGGYTILDPTDFDDESRPGPLGSINGGGLKMDIGADEFDGIPVDVCGPNIYYSYKKFQVSNKVLKLDSVMITDVSKINNSVGFKPRLYFKRNTDPNLFISNMPTDSGWRYVEAMNSASPYHFIAPFNILYGDTIKYNTKIQYFIIAQDSSAIPNVNLMRARTSTFTSSVQLMNAHFPILDSINSVIICKTCKELNGDYILGGVPNFPDSTADYTNIYDFLNDFEPGRIRRINIINTGSGYTNRPLLQIVGGGGSGATATSVINTINGKITGIIITNPGKGYTSKPTIIINKVGSGGSGLVLDVDVSNGAIFNGPVNLLLSNTYSFNKEFDINSGSNSPQNVVFNSLLKYGISSSNRLTIKPDTSVNYIFKSNNNFEPIIKFKNTEYITINGSNNNSNSRNLTFRQLSGSNGTIIMGYSSISKYGNHHIEIENCKIVRDSIFVGMPELIGISFAGINQTTSSVGYCNNYNSFINNEIYGCDYGIYLNGSSYKKDQGNIIKDNYLFNDTFPNRTIGIFAGYQNNLIVEGNYIAGMKSSANNAAISLGVQSFGLGYIGQPDMGNSRITRNIITKNICTGTGGNYGIVANLCNNAQTIIDNNIIRQSEQTNSVNSTVGIFVYGNEYSKYKIFHNTLYLDSTKSSLSIASAPSFNIAITTPCSIDIRNNIFYNNAKSSSDRFAINVGLGYYNLSNEYKDFRSDYNIYFKKDSNSKLVMPYQLNSVNASYINSLSDYQNLTQEDQHSTVRNIDFKLNTFDFVPRINNSSACNINNLALAISGFNIDAFNTIRKNNIVDVGAEEFNFNLGVEVNLRTDTCSTKFVDLTDSSNYNFEYKNSLFAFFEDSLATIPVLRPDSITLAKRYFMKIGLGQCEDIKPIDVFLYQPVFATVNYLNSNYCKSDTSFLTPLVIGNLNGLFSSDTGLKINPQSGLIDISTSLIGPHIIRYIYKSTPYCYLEATDTLTINPSAKAIINANGTTFCDSDSLILMAAPQATYLWSTGETTQQIVVKSSGVYTLYTSNTFCNDSTFISVSKFPKSIIDITSNLDTLFADLTFTNYQWYFNNAPIPNANSSFIIPKISGLYKVSALDLNGCTSISNEFIHVYNSVDHSASSKIVVYPNPSRKVITIISLMEPIRYKIIDATARILMEGKGSYNIDIENILPGIYFIEIELKNGDILTHKFLKE